MQKNYPTSLSKLLVFDNFSIIKLTVVGFLLVVLPLVLALLYSANQVNLLSQQGSSAILNVAELIKTNRQLSLTLTKIERYASQYLVLQDEELKQGYLTQELKLITVLNESPTFQQDDKLQTLSIEFSQTLNIAHQLLTETVTKTTLLAPLQNQFKQLAKINQAINQRSNNLITLQASEIKASANRVSNNMMQALLIIPVSFFIAALFIRLITQPLKQLSKTIQKLETGNFEEEVQLKGSSEVKEVANALELMRTRLHALELQKSSFIRHISHELKTPLAAIREGTELLYDNSVGELNEDQQEISNIIRSSVTRLQRLIEDLLDFNIVLDSTSLQDAEKVVLSPLIDKALALRKLDIKAKNLTINQTHSEVMLHCNAKQLGVILDNLLSNAIKYSPINGVIEIKASVNNEQLQLAISDQGIGINQEQQATVFDAFFQGTPPQNSKIKGSGLGLTIVKELLLRLNGNISLSSDTNSPSGTTFEVTLPRAIKLNN
jgi:two-component system sensor histidine kinase GlrK